jgi:VanZ family protein
VNNSRLRTALPAALWFVLIMVLLSLPGQSFPNVQFWKPDKLAHLGLFGMQTLLLWFAFVLPAPERRSNTHALAIAAVLTVIFGALSEVYQDVFTSRLADLYDVLANAIGVLLAGIFVYAVKPPRLLRLARRLLRLPPA